MLVWQTETSLLAPSSSLAQNTFETPFQRLAPKGSIAMFYKKIRELSLIGCYLRAKFQTRHEPMGDAHAYP